MSVAKQIAIPALLLAMSAAPGMPRTSSLDQFNATDRFRLPSDTIHEGDLYVFAAESKVDGVLDGDFLAWTGAARIAGEISGDVIVGTNQFDLSGRVTDTVRIFAANTVIDGEVDGDVVALTGALTLGEGARVTGNLIVCGGKIDVRGLVRGDLVVTGGEVDIDGLVEGDARIEADAVKLGATAEIAGDLTYTSRRELEREDGAVVGGEIVRTEEPQEEDDDSGGSFGVFWRIWSTLSAMLVGLVLVALFRRFLPDVHRTISGEAVMGTLIGFGAFLVVPAASMLAILLLISAPLGVIGLLLFLVALYLAKMPVAVWLGRRLLSLVGVAHASPYLAILLGLLVLNLLYLVPYLGSLIWLIAIWLGLGTLVLATRNHLQSREAEPIG